MLLCFWFALLIAAMTQVSDSRALNRKKRLTNGDEALLGDFPYQVSIHSGPSHHCGGIIINEFFVLTAAHCLAGLEPEYFQVVSGVVDLTDERRLFTSDVVGVQLFDGYDISEKSYNDIAILKVKSPFKFDEFTRPAKFPESGDNEPMTGAIAWISGFGKDAENAFNSKVLKKAQVTISPLDFCESKYKNKIDVTSDQHICVFDDSDPKKEICKGDSGGPLVLDGTVVGLASTSLGFCGQQEYPALYVRVSKYVDWIRKYSQLDTSRFS